MAVYEVYFDHSYTGEGETRVCTLAVLLALDTTWVRFSTAWNAAMARGGAAGKVLHMRAIMHGVDDWVGWNRDVDKQTNLFKRLVPVCGRWVSLGFGLAYPLAYFEGITVINKRAERAHTALLDLFQTALQGIAQRISPTPQMPVHSYMEEDQIVEADVTRHFYWLTKLYGWEKVFPLIRPLPKGPPPLQAADMLAYEHGRFVSEHVLARSKRPMRELYRKLRACRQFELKHLSREAFNRVCIASEMAGQEIDAIPGTRAEIDARFRSAEQKMHRERTAAGRERKARKRRRPQ